jgi:cytochrome c biogenesis protein CcdA
MKEIDWAKLFNCAVFAALMVMCIIAVSILIISVINLIGIYGYEWLIVIGIILLLFIGLTYYGYKYNITD